MDNKQKLDACAIDLVDTLYNLTGTFIGLDSYDELDDDLVTCKAILENLKKLTEIGIQVVPFSQNETVEGEGDNIERNESDNPSDTAIS